jgi:fructose-bisphosphate aldolase class I
MNLAELNQIAEAMVTPGRGILAADESSGTIKKRFAAIGVSSTVGISGAVAKRRLAMTA